MVYKILIVDSGGDFIVPAGIYLGCPDVRPDGG